MSDPETNEDPFRDAPSQIPYKATTWYTFTKTIYGDFRAWAVKRHEPLFAVAAVLTVGFLGTAFVQSESARWEAQQEQRKERSRHIHACTVACHPDKWNAGSGECWCLPEGKPAFVPEGFGGP